jgi:hypothetical protein
MNRTVVTVAAILIALAVGVLAWGVVTAVRMDNKPEIVTQQR